MCCSEPIRQERVPHFLIISRQLLSSVCMCGTGAPIIRSFHEFIHRVKRGGGTKGGTGDKYRVYELAGPHLDKLFFFSK